MKDKTIIWMIILLSLVISLPWFIHIWNIKDIYLSPEERDAVYQSTIYLQSDHGILLSTLHITNAARADNLMTYQYDFRYPSHIKYCATRIITVQYDLSLKKVVSFDIPFENNDSIC